MTPEEFEAKCRAIGMRCVSTPAGRVVSAWWRDGSNYSMRIYDDEDGLTLFKYPGVHVCTYPVDQFDLAVTQLRILEGQ